MAFCPVWHFHQLKRHLSLCLPVLPVCLPSVWLSICLGVYLELIYLACVGLLSDRAIERSDEGSTSDAIARCKNAIAHSTPPQRPSNRANYEPSDTCGDAIYAVHLSRPRWKPEKFRCFVKLNLRSSLHTQARYEHRVPRTTSRPSCFPVSISRSKPNSK